MHFTLLNETEIAYLQRDKRNSYIRMLQIMNNTPLHVIVKHIANTIWSKIDEPTLRSIYSQLYATQENQLLSITLKGFVPTRNKGSNSDLTVTYTLEDVGLKEPIFTIDEVFLCEDNITRFLSKEALQDIASEAEALIEKEKLAYVREDF